MTLSRAGVPQSLVLVAAGPPSAVVALQHQLGPQLATALGLVWREPLDPLEPQRALAGLAGQGSGLVPLPVDPGWPLNGAGHWAEALGAWRQPALLLLAGEQLETGLPAAMVALLHQWQVPLVGLVQGDAAWDPDARRGDGLPWLGGLDPATGETGTLAAVLALRWRQIASD
jgi:hypothetical protein